MKRPIFYWNGIDEKIYLLGNPVIWWGSSLAMIIFVILFFSNGWWKNSTASLLLLGYISTYIPFIPVPRILFLYHYFGPLIFAIMTLFFLINKMPNPLKKYVIVVFITLATVSFLYFAPLTYGLKMSDAQYQQRAWFESWR
jgi:dolichyl-phosphate-mannose-protein mannosyltransferase